MNNKIRLLFFVFIFSYSTGFSGTIDSLTYSKKIKEQAKRMGEYMIKKDFKSFANYTYPKVIELMGGEESMIHIMEEGTKEMDKNGSYFIAVTIGNPSTVIVNGAELQCTLPQVIEMKVLNGILLVKSTLIAISPDKGKNWYFLDTSDKDIQAMKKILPNLSELLYLPPSQEPVFHHD